MQTITYDPATHVLVPREPTKQMTAAAVIYVNGDAVYKNVAAQMLEIEEGIYGEIYKAMLDIAAKQSSGSNNSSNWISVSERLPDPDAEVLAFWKSGHHSYIEPVFGSVVISQDNYTHWQPLPPPPEQKL